MNYKIFKEKSKIEDDIMKNRVRLDSKKDGLSSSYSSKDFKKTEEGSYKEGQKDGEWIAYYPGGRMPAVVSQYKDGELNGTMKMYDRKGALLEEMDFKDGQKHGRFIVYDEKGKIISEKKFAFGMEVREGNGSFSPN